MSSVPQSPSIQFPIDDCDLDDAELWAVIDSASAASSRSRKSLLSAVKSEPRAFSPVAGEVVQRRPPKTPRLTPDNRVLVIKNSTRTPLAVSSPPPAKYLAKEVSPVIECPQSPAAMNQWRSEEKENLAPHSLLGRFPSVSAFKQYQNAAMAILEKTDYTVISGNPFIKKSGWRKISFYFNLSFEIRDKSIEFDENRNVQRAEFVVRAYMQGGRFSDGWGSCERREKRFMKPNHDIPSTAETRAKNRACQDLLGIGEYRPGVKV